MMKTNVTFNEILSWFLMYKFDHSLDETPEKIQRWIEECQSVQNRKKIHRMLYKEYEEYAEKYYESYIG